MKRILLLVAIFCIALYIQAQDYIVQKTGDTLFCKILREDTTSLHVTILFERKPINTILDKEKINSFGHLPVGYRSPNQKGNKFAVSKGPLNPNRTMLRMSFSGGLGHMFAKTADGLTYEEVSYLNELKSGYSLCSDIGIYFGNKAGIGGKYYVFKTKNQNQFLADDITITFMGPSLCLKKEIVQEKLIFLLSAGYGILNYKNDQTRHGTNVILTGKTRGTVLTVGFDVKLAMHVGFGIECAVIGGSYESLKAEGVTITLAEPENVKRIEGTTGFRFYF